MLFRFPQMLKLLLFLFYCGKNLENEIYLLLKKMYLINSSIKNVFNQFLYNLLAIKN